MKIKMFTFPLLQLWKHHMAKRYKAYTAAERGVLWQPLPCNSQTLLPRCEGGG